MRWRNGLLAASSAIVLAGCGGGGDKATPPPPAPKIPGDVAARLAAEADHLATLTPGTCAARDAAARLRSDVIASIGRIPSRYQEPLTSAANSLAERLATCVNPKPARHPRHEGRHEKPRKPHHHGHDD
jgi:hypothetical protein